MGKPTLAVQLRNKIKHHRYMLRKYKRIPEKREYHERWVAACEKELKQHLEGQ